MRLLLPALLALTTPAFAQEDLSATIGQLGLRAAEAQLASKPAPTSSDRFALGGVRFLAGIERALQLRYQVGLSDGMAVMSGLPVLRLPIEENPDPEPFEPGMIAELFEGVEVDMAGAIDALSGIRDGDAVDVVIDTADLWFDIDDNGTREPGEGVMEVAGLVLDPGLGAFDGFGNPVFDAPLADPQGFAIRFDTADAAWLQAYAHLLSGVSEAVLATDPTAAIARVLDARATFATLGEPAPFDGFAFDAQFGDWADLAAMWIGAVEGPLDSARTRAARDHLLATVEQNRRFWTLVARETDDDREWIPNKNQQSATGLPFPPDTGPRWLAVLSDAEAILRGDLLIPYWRLGPQAGLDLGALLENPPVIDLAGLIQGATLVPYLRQGPLANGQNLWMFTAMMQGDSALYMVMLN